MERISFVVRDIPFGDILSELQSEVGNLGYQISRNGNDSDRSAFFAVPSFRCMLFECDKPQFAIAVINVCVRIQA